MFNFLKKIFKAVPEEACISAEQLEEWFKDKISPIYSEVNEELKKHISSFPTLIAEIKQDMAELEKAGIKEEEKIEEKIKQTVLGNRVNYVRLLSQFINSIKIPSEINAKNSFIFYTELNKKLDDLNKDTQKTYYIVQHLFADHIEKIAKGIKKIDSENQAIKRIIEKNNIAEIEKTKARIKELVQSIERKKRLLDELAEAKKRLENSKKMRQRAETKLVSLKVSEDYENFNKLKQEQDELRNKLNGIRNRIIELFSPLTAALKKLQRTVLENEVLIERYAESPADALFEDKEQKIISILQNLKSSILSGSIEMKDQKKQKVLERVNQITKEQLEGIVKEHNKLKQAESAVNNKIRFSKIIPLIEEAQYRLEHHSQMVNKINKDMIKLEESAARINIEEQKKELENKIKEVINVEIRLN